MKTSSVNKIRNINCWVSWNNRT